MRWDDLFADLEAQLAGAETAAWRGELADRTRAELGRLDLVDRLAAHRHRAITVGVRDVGPLRGRLLDVGREWLMVEDERQRTALLPMAACVWLAGVSRVSQVQPETSLVRRLGLTAVLRTIAQQRLSVTLVLGPDVQVTGTIDRVHSDYLDLAEHPGDRPRRSDELLGVRLVPFTAIALLRPA